MLYSLLLICTVAAGHAASGSAPSASLQPKELAQPARGLKRTVSSVNVTEKTPENATPNLASAYASAAAERRGQQSNGCCGTSAALHMQSIRRMMVEQAMESPDPSIRVEYTHPHEIPPPRAHTSAVGHNGQAKTGTSRASGALTCGESDELDVTMNKNYGSGQGPQSDPCSTDIFSILVDSRAAPLSDANICPISTIASLNLSGRSAQVAYYTSVHNASSKLPQSDDEWLRHNIINASYLHDIYIPQGFLLGTMTFEEYLQAMTLLSQITPETRQTDTGNLDVIVYALISFGHMNRLLSVDVSLPCPMMRTLRAAEAGLLIRKEDNASVASFFVMALQAHEEDLFGHLAKTFTVDTVRAIERLAQINSVPHLLAASALFKECRKRVLSAAPGADQAKPPAPQATNGGNAVLRESNETAAA